MNKRLTAYIVLLGLFICLGVLIIIPVLQIASAALGAPNVSVRTRVNITNSPPSVLNVSITTPVILSANTTTDIYCNVTVRDYNNVSDISSLNVTFFSTLYSKSETIDFNQTHYSNSSCTNFTDLSEFTRTYNCNLTLNYNAAAGNWTCNATVMDNATITGSGFSYTTINDLLAIGVDDLIDFGDLAVLNTSPNIPFNVTNYGNLPLNLTAYGYGATENDSAAVICDQGNISIQNLFVSANFTDITAPIGTNLMIPLNSSNATRKLITNLTVIPYNLSLEAATNTTVWRLFASGVNTPSGLCNGTVVFTAIKAFI